jgi:hypothetical protein
MESDRVMRPFLLAATLVCSFQDPPTITLEKAATVQAAAGEIAKRFGEKLKVEPEIDDKAVELKVRGAGYLQALDALCRAHGGITYFEDENLQGSEELVLRPGTWVEFPTSYSGPFKVIVTSFTRIKMRSRRGDQSWVCVNVQVLSPPSISAQQPATARGMELVAARDAAGQDVLFPTPRAEIDEIVRIGAGGIPVKDFDVSKGLSRLEGKTWMEVARRVPVRIPLDVGAKIDAPHGTLLVQSVSEIKKEVGSLWLVSLKYEPREAEGPGMARMFESTARFDEGEEFFAGMYGDSDRRADIRTEEEGPRPKALFLKARADLRTVEVPFSFANILFKAN